MVLKALEDLLSEHGNLLRPESPQRRELERFREFLVRHGGLRKLEIPGKRAELLDRIEALHCFHFSQYLDWFLPEKTGASLEEIEQARGFLENFNRWLLQRQAISREAFEENLESILGGEVAGEADARPSRGFAEDPSWEGMGSVPEEQDFYVPGEYTTLLSGEFTLTKVQEGILYGRLSGAGDEIGPILVERMVSSGHKVGDRIYLSLGKAGDHWNLLSEGLPRK